MFGNSWSPWNLIPTAYRETLRTAVLAWVYRKDLNNFALLFETDKWGSHWYTQHYQHYFRQLRLTKLTLLEIGVGGYDRPGEGGESLRMWKAYFRKGLIVGVDIHDKTELTEKRIDIRQCNQTDANLLNLLCDEYGGFDIIIDDGSHLNKDVIQTFLILFEHLRSGGIYAVEDTQTSYWPTWGGQEARSTSLDS